MCKIIGPFNNFKVYPYYIAPTPSEIKYLVDGSSEIKYLIAR
jgi:hypothetical protein